MKLKATRITFLFPFFVSLKGFFRSFCWVGSSPFLAGWAVVRLAKMRVGSRAFNIENNTVVNSYHEN